MEVGSGGSFRLPHSELRRQSVVEEVFSGAAGFGLAIDLKIDVLENLRVGRERTFLGKLRGGSGFFPGRFAQGFELFFGEDLLLEQPALEELNGIVAGLDSGGSGIEVEVRRFVRGSELARRCQEILERVEGEVERIEARRPGRRSTK